MNEEQIPLWQIARDAFRPHTIEELEDKWKRIANAVENAVMERLSIRDARSDRELAEELASYDPNECDYRVHPDAAPTKPDPMSKAGLAATSLNPTDDSETIPF